MRYLYIDFEYNSSAEKDLNIICVAFSVYEDREEVYRNGYWLWDDEERALAASELYLLIKSSTVVSFALQAEARSLFTLIPWLTVKDIKGVDLQLNYKMLLNHNDYYSYGKQLIKGKEVVTKKLVSKYHRKEGDDSKSNKPESSLAACTYKLLGIKIDTDRKNLMRNIIIEGDVDKIKLHRNEIQEYCLSDIDNLPSLLEKQVSIMRKNAFSYADIDRTFGNMAEYACRTAKMEMLGYPVEVSELKNLVKNIPGIMNAAAKEVNDEFPDIKPFQYSSKTGLYIKKEKPIRDWVAKLYSSKDWLQTDNGRHSLSYDAFSKYFKSSSPGFGGRMVGYLSTKRSLNGFSPKEKKENFQDRLGSDGRSRPYFNTYGSQSSRNQPSSTYFLPLKSKWMRYLIQPVRGRAIVSIDFASQEFLIAALLSEDKKMVEAYRSSDVYLAFGKDAKVIPKDATKESHGKEREALKAVVLGTSYDMGAGGMARRLSSDEEVWTEEKAQDLIDKFYDTYSDYDEYKKNLVSTYYEEGMLRLSDGWTLFGDNDNWRSVGNCPVQGEGAVIMRRAVALAQDAGIDVIYTLHDALYAEFDSGDSTIPTKLGLCMVQAFIESFPNMKEEAKSIRLDGHCWSYDYIDKPKWSAFFPLKFSERYVDERGYKDLQRFKEFLIN